jgi:excisionase family DNA binding protein
MATSPSLPSDNPAEDIVTAEELAAVLKVDPHTVLNWAKAGIIPEAFRVGRTVRFSRDAVTDGKLSTADAVKFLSLVAVRQHQNRFEDAARATLVLIETLPLTHPDAGTWFIDAAEIIGCGPWPRRLAAGTPLESPCHAIMTSAGSPPAAATPSAASLGNSFFAEQPLSLPSVRPPV